MSREDRLAELLDRWEDATAQGQPTTPQDVCRDAPDLLADFTRLLRRLGLVNPILQGDGSVAPSPQDLIGRIDAGRYVPVSYHARGGLGLVFVAEDRELHRSVALKWMQTLPAMDSAARRRFVVEAEITGKLEHPGVVPVYGVGADADGRPYYAMRFIHGSTLGDAADQLHRNRSGDPGAWRVEFRRLLRAFVSVCETIAYAHVRGVVHRDLKPANVMLGPYGETLVVDWGLAKRLDRPGAGESAETGFAPLEMAGEPGDATVYGRAKGSPSFMSPEQARGAWDEVGPETDVYALGATLYVLLTGRKPYDGDTPDRVIAAVVAGPPAAPRRINPAAPRALEAVCRKAMARRPEDRYPSARDLAADVDRWLADEPVSAWREPLRVRARRWIRRHRTLVSVTVAAIAVAAVCLAVLGVWLDQKNRALTAANATADRHLRRNLDHLSGIFQFSIHSKRMAAVRGDPAFAAMLDHLSDYFDEFAREAPGHREARQARARVHYLRIVSDQAPGLPPKVEARLRQARAVHEDALAADPDDGFALWGLAALGAEQARRLAEDGRFDEARADLAAAYRRLTERRAPPDDAHALAVATVCMNLFQVWQRAGGAAPTELLPMLDRAIDMNDRLADPQPLTMSPWSAAMGRWMAADGGDPAGRSFARIVLFVHRGELRIKELGRTDDGVSDFQAAVRAFEDGRAALHDDVPAVEAAARARFHLARVAHGRRRYRESWDVLLPAYRSFGPLARRFPDRVDDPHLPDEIESGLIETGVLLLGSLSPAVAADRAVAAAVLPEAIRALDQWQAARAARPIEDRDWSRELTVARWRSDLLRHTQRFRDPAGDNEER